jgi:hypothetical protein
MPNAAELWAFLPLGYALSVVLETPVLLVGLSPRHSVGRKLLAGLWLTACTYPIVVLVLPPLLWREPPGTNVVYLAVAETFAPAAECLLFWLAFWKLGPPTTASTTDTRDLLRDLAAIVLANLTSFAVGLVLF